MGLNENDLAAIDSVLAACGPAAVRGVVGDLRARLPGFVILSCDAADVLEDPWRSYPAIDLHFVDTRNHCTEMTRDPAAATGVLLATRGEAA
jgi:hypothetical protein